MLKRSFDIIVTLSFCPIILPLIFFISLLVAVTLGRPVFFRQQRSGFKGQVFTLWKFRTMTEDRDTNATPLPDNLRMTRFGKILRASSLDELPSLWNVLKGDISLVGPRPLLVDYLPLYSPTQARRHEVRPGVTGWAQINGRNTLSWEEKFKLDVWYVDNRSFRLDLKILGLTIWRVLRRDDISAKGNETMPPFRG